MAVCILLLSSCSASENTSAPNQRVAGGQITPLLQSALSTPRWFTGTDGQPHLVYELMLTNVVPATVNLNAVEVNNADAGATLIRLAGDALRAATSLAASPETPSTQLPPSSVGVVWLDIPLGATAVPAAITHRMTIDPPAGVRCPASRGPLPGKPCKWISGRQSSSALRWPGGVGRRSAAAVTGHIVARPIRSAGSGISHSGSRSTSTSWTRRTGPASATPCCPAASHVRPAGLRGR